MFLQKFRFLFLSFILTFFCFGESRTSILLKKAEDSEENDKLEDALQYAQKAVLVSSKDKGGTEVLDAYKLLIQLSYDLGRYDETIDHANQLMEKDDSKEAQFFGRRYLGHAHMDSNRSKRAIMQYQRALKINTQDKEGEANIHFNLGGIFLDSKDYEKSEDSFVSCIKILKRKNNLKSQLAKTFTNLALLYYSWGKDQQALENFLNAEKIHVQSDCRDCLDCIDLFEKIANFQRDIMGDEIAALQYWEKYLYAMKLNGLEKSFDYFKAQFQAGYSANESGLPIKALKYYNNALANAEKFKNEQIWLGLLHLNRGNSLSILRRHSEALESYMLLLEMIEKTPSLAEEVNHPYNNISIEYDFLGNQQKSEFYLNKAILHTKDFYGKNSDEHIICLTNLAAFYADNDSNQKSININKKLIKILESEGRENIIPYINISKDYDRVGDDKLALKFSKLFLRKSITMNGEFHRFTSFAYDNLSRHLQEFGDKEKSLAMALKANRNNEVLLRESFESSTSEERYDILDYLYEDRNPFDRVASLGKPEPIIETLLKNKGIILDSLISELRNSKPALDTEISSVLRNIPKRHALLEFVQFNTFLLRDGVETDNTSYGAVLAFEKNEQTENIWVPLGDYQIIDKSLYSLLNSAGNAAGITRELRLLYKLLAKPIFEKLPSGIDSIIISPDSDLNFVPFASLISEEGKFLCEDYNVLNMSTGRDLLFTQKAGTDLNKTIEIFANPSFDQSNTNDSNIVQTQISSLRNLRNMNLDPLPGSEEEAFDLSALSQSEGLTCKVRLNSDASELNLRKIKSPTILHLATHGWFISNDDKRLDKSSMNFFRESKNRIASNPMHRSGLALAGAKNTLELWEKGKFVDPANDGILTAEEASQLDLRDTWLTVLSACDTGSGVARAGEGVLGLRRAFAMAGTQNLLLTLWPVDDNFTKDFMISFYKEALKTGNAPKAMAKVQKEWLIKLREERSISQAVKLAGPFVLTFRGNPELN